MVDQDSWRLSPLEDVRPLVDPAVTEGGDGVTWPGGPDESPGAGRAHRGSWRTWLIVVFFLVVVVVLAADQVLTRGPPAAAGAVEPGVVDVTSTLGLEGATAEGTGMVLTSSGEVVTNNHVIDGATSVSVVDVANGRRYTATVVGTDAAADVAVLQLSDASKLHTVPLGSSAAVHVGDQVIGIGNAGGVGGAPSVVEGTVVALGQSIVATAPMGPEESLHGLIETDVPIVAGDSGGPLVNASGKVVGMNTAASNGYSFSSGSTRAFAVPIATVTAVASQVESGRSSTDVHVGPSAFLGVVVQESAQGVSVVDVFVQSPAAAVGLVPGDLITSVGGTAVSSVTQLTDDLRQYHPGDTVTVGWDSLSGQAQSATVTLTTGPAD